MLLKRRLVPLLSCIEELFLVLILRGTAARLLAQATATIPSLHEPAASCFHKYYSKSTINNIFYYITLSKDNMPKSKNNNNNRAKAAKAHARGAAKDLAAERAAKKLGIGKEYNAMMTANEMDDQGGGDDSDILVGKATAN